MDTNIFIVFTSLLCALTGLNFMELRRIRKKLDSQQKVEPKQ